ncbi:HAD-IIIC family phosphatase [Komagataeibacter europaeus]|nr:HAD-IIIC family phosphatase [Komagataeibacter europaeus]
MFKKLRKKLKFIINIKKEIKYQHYKLARVSSNGLKGFAFHRLEPSTETGADKKLNVAFFGPCALLPIINYAINHGHHVIHVAMRVDESRQSHFSPPLSEVNHEKAEVNVIGLPLRSVMAEGAVPFDGFQNEIFWPRLKSESDHENYLKYCVEYISDFVDSISELLGGKPTFFLSFWEPRQNFMGSLFPHFDLSNPQYFVMRLNAEMERIIRAYPNTYLLDVNNILNSMGRFRIQDDYARELSHASNIFDTTFEDDTKRIRKSTPLSHIYDLDGQPAVYGHCVFNAIRDNLAIINAAAPIKLIIVDLDDTMWRGVLADGDRSPYERTDYWPTGLAEALLVYKARGGLLAICSKNDPELARAEFERVWGGRLRLDDFVSVKINFQPKSENILEILDEVNLLPANVLFVDDNPREIDEVRSVIPDLRFLSEEHMDWRRAILFSPSTQVPRISTESQQRTQSLRAKINRDQVRQKMSREEWLRSLQIKQRYAVVRSENDRNFARAFELLNKTNQFNTTGQRWSLDAIKTLFARGGYIFCVFLQDKETDNGLIGLHLVQENRIIQSILSCRVFGLCSEYASMHVLAQHILKEYPTVTGHFISTGRNFYCENYLEKCGFTKEADGFLTSAAPPSPPEITNDNKVTW